MGAWNIQCINPECGEITNPGTIDNLADYCDSLGRFQCSQCGGRGYISKSFKLQEGDKVEYGLLGILCGTPNQDKGQNQTYFPFVFLVSEDPRNQGPSKMRLDYLWFRYYKDTRHIMASGLLKMGDGPGGGPMVELPWMRQLIKQLDQLDNGSFVLDIEG